ncbi:unnamed protein product [Staurois parvus]|uniref:Sleeping Beauty transposase HTH domain-containing protein n=1 Tax=Staurois parvus TaxID=386267 RepID=A0ABN9D9Q2_9NEOB|nr:unnamed protein product [Staurois parvus]
MGIRKELSKVLRNKVMDRYKDGKGHKEISKALNMPISTVKSSIKKWKVLGSLDTKPSTGRPRKIAAATD